MTMRTGSAYVTEYIYIIDFVSVVVICRSVCNTAKVGKESLRKRVERVADYVLPNLPLLVVAWKRWKSFTVARSGASTCFWRIRSRPAASSGTGNPFWMASSFISSWCQLKCHIGINRCKEANTKALSHDIAIQRCILIPLNLVHMLVAVS